MRVVVTGSAGHLGEALVRTLRVGGVDVAGVDRVASAWTTHVGSITDRHFVQRCLQGADRVLHAATLHKPHVATHTQQEFIDTNLTGTLNLLEESAAVGVKAFVFTSTTSVFGDAMVPPPGAPAVWVTEAVTPVAKNIYGATKAAAEDLCQLAQRNHGLPCVVLRTSRFFPEQDDSRTARESYADANLKTNEFLFRRVDVEDVVSAHLLAMERAPALGFGKYIVSATAPFTPSDLAALPTDAAAVIQRLLPETTAAYAKLGWRLPTRIDRVYVNQRARQDLGWEPRHDFSAVLQRQLATGDWRSPLAQEIGAKGYHAETFSAGPYPVQHD